MSTADAINGVPIEVVSKHYEMDFETEEVLGNAYKLRDGMVVLMGASFLRVDLEEMSHRIETAFSEEGAAGWKENLLTRNRWGRVSNLEFDMVHRVVGVLLTYADGSSYKHEIGISWPWIVKKDSIPGSVDRVHELTEILRDLISKYNDETLKGDHEEAALLVRKTAKKLYQSF